MQLTLSQTVHCHIQMQMRTMEHPLLRDAKDRAKWRQMTRCGNPWREQPKGEKNVKKDECWVVIIIVSPVEKVGR